MDRKIIIIAHDMRSCHNVGSLLRTAEGLGVYKVYLSGYTPYPTAPNDTRLPHESRRISNQIHKTALDAENLIHWEHTSDITSFIQELKNNNYVIAGLEQSTTSIPLQTYDPPANIALILGREVEGIEKQLLALTDITLEIPMFGRKESLNVVQAAAIALYHLRFHSP